VVSAGENADERQRPSAALLDEVERTRQPAVHAGSECLIPLVDGEAVVGALWVGELREPGAFTAERLAVLMALANQAAIGLAALRRLAGVEAENTALRRDQDTVRRSEELYRRAIVQAGAVPYVLDYATSSYTFIGEGIEELTGFTAAEFNFDYWAKMGIESVLMGDQAGMSMEEAVERTRSGEFPRWRCDQRVRTRDGRSKWLSDASVEIIGEGGRSTGSIGMLQDVTDRRQTEETLSRFATILEATTDVVGMAHPDGQVLYLNRAGRRLLGFGEHEDLSAVSVQDLHPAWAAARLREQALPAAIREGAWTGETSLLSRDGEEIPVSQVVLAHKSESGDVRFLSTIARDISERLKLEEQLRRAQRLEAVGRLAGGIAHDFNNMLVVINGYSDLIARRVADDEVRADVREIRRAGERAATLTRQLLAFSRQQVLRPRVLSLNDVVRGVEAMLRALIGDDIVLVTALAPALGSVLADPGQLEQIVVNLAVNARDAMPGGGTLLIETAEVSFGADQVRQLPGMQAGRDYVRLRVRDSGIGMDAQTRERLFEPFFTTKPLGEGTGLGLAMVLGIVEQSGGHLDVTSSPGAGSTFDLYLPRSLAAAEPISAGAPPTGPPAAGWETVLLVEDDPNVRAATRRFLEDAGHQVLEAADGGEALEVLERYPGDVHLVITDVVMPGMSGRDLVERLARLRPRLRTLYISGYADSQLARRQLAERDVALLQKPFTAETLTRKVRDILNDR